MKKLLLIAVFALVGLGTVNAQETSYGLTAGYHMLSISVSGGDATVSADGSGYYVGVFADFNVGEKFNIQPEIHFASAYKDGESANELIIPIMAKYFVSDVFNIQAGPQLDFVVDDESEGINKFGVGIGFGLQSIASNFISGLIILLDRSLSIGDYIELEDGRSGSIRELNLRAVSLETFDGKDIVVPNDVFFSQTFTNWTHKNNKQRYAIDFDVAYATDLDRLFPLIKALLASHPKVLAGNDYTFEEQPDVEISGFGDNGIQLHLEFWMEAIDDGEHRVGGDLLYSIWQLMNQEGFEFPFPQREVRILNEGVRRI